MTSSSAPSTRPSRWTPATTAQWRLLFGVIVLFTIHVMATALFVLCG